MICGKAKVNEIRSLNRSEFNDCRLPDIEISKFVSSLRIVLLFIASSACLFNWFLSAFVAQQIETGQPLQSTKMQLFIGCIYIFIAFAREASLNVLFEEFSKIC
ncbi:hypothetical protein BD560DRAFT_424465 [Blakeslea trispora]|nr:hypothetical protein BD560DRAFT_424465 [Blakeslea trispora]